MPEKSQGRNDLCACGSGKKYKHCCLPASNVVDEGELVYRRYAQALDGLGGKMLKFAQKLYGDIGMQEAWDEYMQWPDEIEPLEPSMPLFAAFAHWYVHEFRPDPECTEIPGLRDADLKPDGSDNEAWEGFDTIAHQFMAKHVHTIDSLSRKYLASCGDAPRCFYEVESVQPGRLQMRCIFSNELMEVRDHAASKSAKPKDILYSRIVKHNGIATLEGVAPFVIPQIEKIELLHRRDEIIKIVQRRQRLEVREAHAGRPSPTIAHYLNEEKKRDAAIARGETYEFQAIEIPNDIAPLTNAEKSYALAHDMLIIADDSRYLTVELLDDAREEFHGQFLSIYERLLKPRTPSFLNMGGEEMELNTLYFDLVSDFSAEAAMRAIAHLDTMSTIDEINAQAKRDIKGAVIEYVIHWLPGENPSGASGVIFGTVIISKGSIRAEANSRGRAATLRLLIESSLGENARFRNASIKSFQSMMRDAKPSPSATARDNDLLNSPEVQAMIAQKMAEHYATWPDEKLPALNNRTPREAVKTQLGREATLALLDGMTEKSRARSGSVADRLHEESSHRAFAEIRKTLGLLEST